MRKLAVNHTGNRDNISQSSIKKLHYEIKCKLSHNPVNNILSVV